MTDVRVGMTVFPASVDTPAGSWREAMAAVVDGVVTVWVAPDRVAYSAPLLAYDGHPASVVDLQTADGVVSVTRLGGCGCGNPLKNWDPYAGKRQLLVGLDG